MGRPKTHGHSRSGVSGGATRTYESWLAMRKRCRSTTHMHYGSYGGRGIAICERWEEFENFLADMGERPEGKTLDRFPDKDGNYEPGNCRWATSKEQSRNKRGLRLTEEVVVEIRDWAAAGVPCSWLAEALNLQPRLVRRVVNRERWT